MPDFEKNLLSCNDNNQEYDNGKNKLVSFLNNLIITLKNDNLTEKEQKLITEFYISWMFNKNYNVDINNKNLDYMKLLTMGWYIYSQFLDMD